jgi:hypothetical protein
MKTKVIASQKQQKNISLSPDQILSVFIYIIIIVCIADVVCNFCASYSVVSIQNTLLFQQVRFPSLQLFPNQARVSKMLFAG